MFDGRLIYVYFPLSCARIFFLYSVDLFRYVFLFLFIFVADSFKRFLADYFNFENRRPSGRIAAHSVHMELCAYSFSSYGPWRYICIYNGNILIILAYCGYTLCENNCISIRSYVPCISYNIEEKKVPMP